MCGVLSAWCDWLLIPFKCITNGHHPSNYAHIQNKGREVEGLGFYIIDNPLGKKGPPRPADEGKTSDGAALPSLNDC